MLLNFCMLKMRTFILLTFQNIIQSGKCINLLMIQNEEIWHYFRKQLLRGVPWKRCSKNMQQIYRRTPMPKRNFNKVAKQFYWNHTSVWVLSCKFVAYFQNTFPRKPSGWLLLYIVKQKLPKQLRRIMPKLNKHDGADYCLNCFHSVRTKN